MATDTVQTSPRVITSLLAQNPDIRKIRLYRNGDENFCGKELVFNRRQVHDMEHLLQKITDHVELDRGARSIHTPNHGSKVDKLDDITDKGEYVVVGYGKFKKLEYNKLLDRHVTRLRDNKKHGEEADIRKPLKPIESNRYHVPSRIRNAVVDVVPIYVFRNGDEREPPKRIILTHRMMSHWALILAEISQYVQPQYTATHYLYTLEGERVVHKSEIQAGKYYVAVGYRTPFRRLNYGQIGYKPVFSVSPRVMRRNLTNDAYPYERPINSMLSEDESVADTNSLPPTSTQSDPITAKRRSRLSRKNYHLVYNDGKEVFPSRAVRPYRHQEPLPAIQDSDRDGGPFKARGVRSETEDARQIDETADTKTDLPLDMQRAEEVEEDQFYGRRATQTVEPTRRTRRVIRGTEQNGGNHSTTLYPKQSNIYRDTRRDERRRRDDDHRHGKVFRSDNDSVEDMEKTTKSVEEEDMERGKMENYHEEEMEKDEEMARESSSRTADLAAENDMAKTTRDFEDAVQSAPNEENATGTVEQDEENETATTLPELEDSELAAQKTSIDDDATGTVEPIEDNDAAKTQRDMDDTADDTELTARKSHDAESPQHDEENEKVDDDRTTTNQHIDENDEAAIKIQAAYRGYSVRKQLKQTRNSEN